MSATLTLDGVDALRRMLDEVPESFKAQALVPIVRESSEGMRAEVEGAYHKRTGRLASRVVVERQSNALRAKVRTKAPHAHLYEYGSIRRYTRGSGANRGQMPAQPTFVPAAIRWRARMVDRVLAAMRGLRIPGLTGSPEVRQA